MESNRKLRIFHSTPFHSNFTAASDSDCVALSDHVHFHLRVSTTHGRGAKTYRDSERAAARRPSNQQSDERARRNIETSRRTTNSTLRVSSIDSLLDDARPECRLQVCVDVE